MPRSVSILTVGPPDGHHQSEHEPRCDRRAAYLTRALKAPTLRESIARLAERARAENWTHEEYLAACLQREVSARESHGGEGGIRAARFPARKSLEEFDFDHARGLKRDTIAHLGTLDFVTARDNVVFLGPPGAWLTLRISPINCVKESTLVGFDLDTQALPASAVDMDGLQARRVGPCATRFGGRRQGLWPCRRD
jgi:hypothetical protein